MHTHDWQTNPSTGLAECSCGRQAVGVPMNAAHSLTQTLAYLYLTHRPEKNGRHEILDRERVIFTGTAVEVWRWLRETGRIPKEAP